MRAAAFPAVTDRVPGAGRTRAVALLLVLALLAAFGWSAMAAAQPASIVAGGPALHADDVAPPPFDRPRPPVVESGRAPPLEPSAPPAGPIAAIPASSVAVAPRPSSLGTVTPPRWCVPGRGCPRMTTGPPAA